MGTKIRYKTKKLIKLENNRYSILTNDLECCYLCFNDDCHEYDLIDIHEIYGGANRQISMENGFCVPLCRHHHILATNDNSINLILKQLCQKKYEKTHSREDFIHLIGKNYL